MEASPCSAAGIHPSVSPYPERYPITPTHTNPRINHLNRRTGRVTFIHTHVQVIRANGRSL